MNFEDIIPVIAVIIYFLLLFLKSKKRLGKQDKGPGAAKKSPVKKTAGQPRKIKKTGLGVQLQDFFKEIREEMEKAAQAEKEKEIEGPDFWKQEMGKPGKHVQKEVIEIDLPEPEFARTDQPRTHIAIPQKEIRAEQIVLKPVRKSRGFNRKRLRNAVVMSEIIAPPVGLRDQ